MEEGSKFIYELLHFIFVPSHKPNVPSLSFISFMFIILFEI